MCAIMQTLPWKIWIVDMQIKRVLRAEAADSGTELHQTEASLCEVSDFFHPRLAFYIAVPCLNPCMLLSKLKVTDRWHIWVKVKEVCSGREAGTRIHEKARNPYELLLEAFLYFTYPHSTSTNVYRDSVCLGLSYVSSQMTSSGAK